MAIPLTYPLPMSAFSTELGLASAAANSLSFIKSKAKSGQVYNSFYYYRGNSYYQQNTAGNCNNGNCAHPTSTGAHACINCSLAAINCANCDSQAYLQSGANCACTYNCTQVADQSYNCGLNCTK